MNPNVPNNPDDDIGPRRAFPGPNAPKHQQYKFSPDEIRVIKECNKEAFYQRCIPVSGILGFGTYYGIKTGYFKPSPRFGAFPKVSIAVILGYFVGKISYQGRCAEKLMQLPDSQIGEALRRKRRGTFQDSNDPSFGSGMSLAPFGNVKESDVYSDLNPNNSLDLDTTRPENPGLDDYHRPSLDNNSPYEEEMPPVQKHTTSYDELRKQNRDEYIQKRVGNYREPVRTHPAPTSLPTSNEPTQSGDGNTQAQTPRNKYGDVWG